MSFSNRLLPKKGHWFTDWDPSKRPIPVPLPKLEYESHFEIWEWKLRTLLEHNSLSGFITFPGPSFTPPQKDDQEAENAAAATYCLVILGSCISEDILADLLTLSPGNKLPEDPYSLLQKVKNIVKDVQDLWKETTNPEFWGLFTGREDQFQRVEQLFDKLEGVRNKTYTKESWRKFILMAALLTKRKFPFCLPHSVQKYVDKASNKKVDVGEKEWQDMKSEMMNAT